VQKLVLLVLVVSCVAFGCSDRAAGKSGGENSTMLAELRAFDKEAVSILVSIEKPMNRLRDVLVGMDTGDVLQSSSIYAGALFARGVALYLLGENTLMEARLYSGLDVDCYPEDIDSMVSEVGLIAKDIAEATAGLSNKEARQIGILLCECVENLSRAAVKCSAAMSCKSARRGMSTDYYVELNKIIAQFLQGEIFRDRVAKLYFEIMKQDKYFDADAKRAIMCQNVGIDYSYMYMILSGLRALCGAYHISESNVGKMPKELTVEMLKYLIQNQSDEAEIASDSLHKWCSLNEAGVIKEECAQIMKAIDGADIARREVVARIVRGDR